jgi:hypothetical protein
VRKLAVLKNAVLILFLCVAGLCAGQDDSLAPTIKKDSLKLVKKDSVKPYNRKEEILFDGKRYRKYNNYLTIGAGPNYSSIRSSDQKNIGADFQFHARTQYFQLGAFLSGDDFTNNKNTQFHLGIGLRHERNYYHFAAFIGPSYSIFVTEKKDTAGVVIDHPVSTTLGGHISLQAVYKFKYDVGIGGEIFADISNKQQIVGARAIIYFSGAYRGIKRGFKTKSTYKK